MPYASRIQFVMGFAAQHAVSLRSWYMQKLVSCPGKGRHYDIVGVGAEASSSSTADVQSFVALQAM